MHKGLHAQFDAVRRDSSPSSEGLRLERLTRVFADGIRAVDDLSVLVAEGEFMTLLGPSGCGKTTTLRMIAGLERPSSGEIYYGEDRWTSVPPHRRPVNTVFQNYALFPHMSVRQNVAYGLQARGLGGAEVRTRVQDWLDRVGLADLSERPSTKLSGGQQQRVALARALVLAPKVLLLDEPLGALDLQLRKQMQLVLMELRRETQTTFLYVTHDQEEAMTMSDQVAVLKDGRIEQIGKPHQLYYEPATKFVAGFVGETNLLEGRVIARVGSTLTVDIGGMRVVAPLVMESRPLGVATVAIRPEALVVGDAAETLTNHCLASIEERAVVGGDLRLFLRDLRGLSLRARAPVTAESARLRRGERVHVGWAVEAGRAYVD